MILQSIMYATTDNCDATNGLDSKIKSRNIKS